MGTLEATKTDESATDAYREEGRALRRRPPDGQDVRASDRQRNGPRDGLPADEDRAGRLRPDVLRPGIPEHGILHEPDHLHRRRQGNPALSRLSDRGPRREVLVPRGRLPPALRRAAEPERVRGVDQEHHVPHHDPRVAEEAHGRVQLRRASDGHGHRDRRGDVHVLPGGAGRPQRREPDEADASADREDADDRRVRVQALDGDAVRLSLERARLLRELPHDAVQDTGRELQAESRAREGPRRPLHPPRRSRAELRHGGHAGNRLRAHGSVLGARGSGGGALRPAPRRSQRGSPEDARADRLDLARPRVHQGGEGGQGREAADGLRPPGLQELRPAREDHQAHGRGGVRGDGTQPAPRHRARARADRPAGRVLRPAQALPERGLLLRPDLPGDRNSDRRLHGPLRDPAHVGVARAVGGAPGGPGGEDRAAAAGVSRPRRARVHSRWKGADRPDRIPGRGPRGARRDPFPGPSHRSPGRRRRGVLRRPPGAALRATAPRLGRGRVARDRRVLRHLPRREGGRDDPRRRPGTDLERPDGGRARSRTHRDLRRRCRHAGRSPIELGARARDGAPRVSVHDGRAVDRGRPGDLRRADRARPRASRARRGHLEVARLGPSTGAGRDRRNRSRRGEELGSHLLGRRALLLRGGPGDPSADALDAGRSTTPSAGS